MLLLLFGQAFAQDDSPTVEGLEAKIEAKQELLDEKSAEITAVITFIEQLRALDPDSDLLEGKLEEKANLEFERLQMKAEILELTRQLLEAQEKADFLVRGEVELQSGSYEFTHSIQEEISPQYNYGTKEQEAIKKGARIRVLYKKDAIIYYEYWNYKDESSESFKTFNENNPVFYMNEKEFEQVTKKLYRIYKGASVGAYTIPFRLRDIGGGDDFDFESSLSLQANLVFGIGNRDTEDSFLDASIGLGLTGVNLTPENSEVETERSANAFTVSTGAVFKFAPYANLGLFIGWDFLGQKDSDINWQYDGKTWVGLGLNISFNQVKTDKAPSNAKNEE